MNERINNLNVRINALVTRLNHFVISEYSNRANFMNLSNIHEILQLNRINFPKKTARPYWAHMEYRPITISSWIAVMPSRVPHTLKSISPK